jgi:hypothetical protein
MEFDLRQLAKFLVKAKIQTYAGDGKEIVAQRPGFSELEFKEGDFEYRDSYSGFYQAPGQEVVRYKRKPIWVMAYSGGMEKKYHGDADFSEKTFSFLKQALMLIEELKPFRGPDYLKEGDYEYINKVDGDITNFRGQEQILYKRGKVFTQDYIGGLIIQK